MRTLTEQELPVVGGGAVNDFASYTSNVLIFVDGGENQPIALNWKGALEIAWHYSTYASW